MSFWDDMDGEVQSVNLCVTTQPPCLPSARQQRVKQSPPAQADGPTWRRSAARGQDVQGDAVGPGRQAELLPLEVKVAPFPLLVAHADAVGDGQRQRVGLLSDVQQL